MTNILVVERLTIFNLFIVIIYKIFKFEVYIFKFSKKLANWRLLKFLSLRVCNFEECTDIDFDYFGGKNGDAIDEVTSQFVNSDLLNNFIPLFTNVKDSRKKIKLLVKEYVLRRCSSLNAIQIWINGYFIDHKKDSLNIYLLGDICKIGAHFLKIRSNSIKVSPVFSSNFFIFASMVLKVFSALYRKIFSIIYRAIPIKSGESNINQLSPVSDNVDTLSYKVLYFPNKSIFYGGKYTLYVKDNFYSKDMNSVFYPSNILHIELENITITENKYKYYIENAITTMILPKVKVKKLYSCLFYILGEIGVKKILLFLRKDFILFCVFLLNAIKFLSKKELIKENYNAKLVLVGHDILFPKILSLAFESLKIRTISTQERFLPTFMPHLVSFFIDTYLCHSQLVCKIIEKSNDKFANNCLPCGQTRTDILINYQKNNTSENKRFTIIAFDFHSNYDLNINRLNPLVNWRANASFYKDLCKLAERFTEVDIIIRGKNMAWTNIPYFKEVLAKVNRISNIWIDDDYSKIRKQYKLATISDLAILKYTSIGDELLAVGKKVIYYDFIPNSSSYFPNGTFNYNGYNIFAHSYDNLEHMVKIVVNGGKLLTDEEVLDLQVITNNIPADGRVKQRVMKNLDIIYGNEK